MRTLLSITLLGLLMFCHPFFGMAQEVVDAGQRCALLAARGDVGLLTQLYDSIRHLPVAERDSLLTPDRDLFCRMSIARAQGDNRLVSVLIDSLEQKHADKLDVRGLLALSDVRLEALRQLGDYPALKKYCKNRLDWCTKRGIKVSRQKNLKFYLALAERFPTTSLVTEEWGSEQFSVPISRDWPLHIPVSINGNYELPFMLDTGIPYSFISEQEAKECGLKYEGDPLSLVSVFGTIKVRPAIIDTLMIGQFSLYHVMVYVVGKEVAAPYNCAIGNDILRHLDQIELLDQQLIVTHNGLLQGDKHLCFSTRGSLDIELTNAEGYCRYEIDSSYRTNAVEAENRKLGVPYLRAAQSAVLNFKTMTAQFEGTCEYQERRIADYLADEALFDLLRNETALYYTSTEAEIAQMESALDKALTPPTLEELSPAIRAAVITPEIAASLHLPPHQLLLTSRGLAFERSRDKQFETVILTDENVKTHKIDLENMTVY